MTLFQHGRSRRKQNGFHSFLRLQVRCGLSNTAAKFGVNVFVFPTGCENADFVKITT